MPAEVQIFAIAEGDVEEVSRFLRKTFQADKNWVPFRPEVVRWKALGPHPLWEGSRGIAIRKGGEIVAHGCVMPTRFVHESGEALAACVIDWAADRAVPGGGMAIYQHVGRIADALIGVGGSDDAQRLLPRMGFKARQELETFARVTKPVSRFLGTRDKTWRDAARLGRNLVRSLQAARPEAGEWRARRVEQFDESAASVMPRVGLVSGTVCYRDALILNYFLGCPAARMEGYLLERAGAVSGYCVLAFLKSECRIAELWVNSAEEQEWARAFAAAFAGREGSQVTIACGTGVSKKAAGRAGFHVISRQPVYVKDPGGKMPERLDAAMGMLDFDAFYL